MGLDHRHRVAIVISHDLHLFDRVNWHQLGPCASDQIAFVFHLLHDLRRGLAVVVC